MISKLTETLASCNTQSTLQTQECNKKKKAQKYRLDMVEQILGAHDNAS